jgi:4-oxalocrotonate tautomerase
MDFRTLRAFVEVVRQGGFDLVMIEITLNEGRTVEQKKALYEAIADDLAASPGIRREDVFINLVEVGKENWSHGNGLAQYAL